MTSASYFKVKISRPFPKERATLNHPTHTLKRKQLNTVRQPGTTEAEHSRKEGTKVDGADILQTFNMTQTNKPEKKTPNSFHRVRSVCRKPVNMRKSYCYLADNHSQSITPF